LYFVQFDFGVLWSSTVGKLSRCLCAFFHCAASANKPRLTFHPLADGDILTKVLSPFWFGLSNQSAEDILEADMGFIDEIGLKEHLSPTRANGVGFDDKKY
jgi:sulfur transfer protein SufE